jgi:ComF family protein
MVNNWLENTLSGLFPPTCLLCGAPGAEGLDLCAGCLADLPQNATACGRCALPLPPSAPPGALCGACQRRAPPHHATLAPLRYEGVVPFLVTGLKFQRRMSHARLLGALLFRALVPLAEQPRPQLILPVPLHPQRHRERGFNQALEIVREPARRLGIPLDTRSCARQRSTRPQSGLDAAARRRNLRGAFVTTRRPSADHVVIFDDVITTGHTVAELARVVRASGVPRVDVWSVARTGR